MNYINKNSDTIYLKDRINISDKVFVEILGFKDIRTSNVSIVIPTIGRDTLNLAVQSIIDQSVKPFEILIVFDGERHGVSWSRNTGFENAKSDIIAFLDDDCIANLDWLENMLGVFEKYNADGVSGTYEETDQFLNEIRLRRKIPITTGESNVDYTGIGGNSLYKKKWLNLCKEKDGYVFNEYYVGSEGGEDYDLAWRLRRYGAKLIFAPYNHKHLKHITSWGFLKLQFNRGMGIFRMHKSYKSSNSKTTIHRGILWDKHVSSGVIRLLLVFWKKIIGPFDFKSFSTLSYFFIFWIGEKIQILGFLWGKIKDPFKKHA